MYPGHNTREEKSVTRRYETGMRSFFLSILGLLLSKGKLAFIFKNYYHPRVTVS